MKKRSKNILVLASTFPRWKNDTTPPFVFELEKRLVNNFKITILSPHHFKAKKHEVMNGLAVKRFQYFWPARWQKLCYQGGILPNLKQNKLLYIQAVSLILAEFISGLQIIRKGKIDLIHAHWLIPQGIVAYLLKKITGTSYIATVHGGDIYGLQNPLVNIVRKIILRNAKVITVVSEAIKKEIIKKYSLDLNIHVIPMGVDTKLFNPNKYDPKLREKYNIQGPFLLFVGRLAEKKGVRYLLQALPAVLKRYPKTKLLIIGEGPLKIQLLNLVTKLKIKAGVTFTGPISQYKLPKYYATADLFISPSIKAEDGDREGKPVTFLEAVSCGIKIVTTIKDTQLKPFLLHVNEKRSIDIQKVVMQELNDNKLKRQEGNLFIKRYFSWVYSSKRIAEIYEL